MATRGRSGTLGRTMALALTAVPLMAQGQAQDPRRFPDLSLRPLFLSGQVLLEDGTPPPEPVLVTSSCGAGPPMSQSYTDSDGRFSFDLGRSSSPVMDVRNASGAGGSSRRDLTGCELRAVATGFASDAIDLSGRRVLESPEVGIIVLRRLEGVVGSTFSATTLLARKEVRETYQNGRELARDKKYEEAIHEYRKAVSSEPRFAAAWFELGLMHQALNRPREAEEAYRHAVTADPEFVKPYRQLAFLSFHQQRWPEVLKATDRLLWLDPVSYLDAYFFDAVAHFSLGDLDAAERSARKATTRDSERLIPKAHAVLGAILIEKGDYAGAAEQLRRYVKIANPGPDVDQARAMLEQLEARLPPQAEGEPE